MIFTRQTYYESGAKSLKILARKLQKQRADNVIHKIRDIDSKTIQYKQEDIQRTFRKYYQRLYTQPQLEGQNQNQNQKKLYCQVRFYTYEEFVVVMLVHAS